jgi:hypothetical protein
VAQRPAQWEQLNGVRVGGFIGAMAGALLLAVTGMIWPVPIGAIVGALIGFSVVQIRGY